MIKQKEYVARRKELMSMMHSNSIAIISSAPEKVRSRDTHYPYKQNVNLTYLCGFPEPEAVLVLIPGRQQGEMIVFCGALVGSGIGFLWFNTYPAQVFMGDVGSLSLGASLGIVTVIIRHEYVLLVMGGLFVIEALSVIVQVISFKLTGKRVFNMAPLHHHYELKGWPEPRVIVRFWIITFMLVLLGLALLRLR